MAQVIASTAGYYETQEVELGRVYKWCPEIVTVQCSCGERPNLTGSETDCDACGADHGDVIREWLEAARRLEEGKIHPWRYDGRDEEEDGLPF